MTNIRLWDALGVAYLAGAIGLFLWLMWRRM